MMGRSPTGGDEFFLAGFELSHIYSFSGRNWIVPRPHWEIEANRRRTAFTLTENVWQLSTSIHPRCEYSGWIMFQIPEGADVTGICYREWAKDHPEIWFAVE